MALFRSQIVENQKYRLFGEISLAQPLRLRTIIVVGAGFLVLILTFLLSTGVHRKERVHGIVVPSKGVLELPAAQPGTLAKLLVKSGATVSKDQPLFSVVNQTGSEVAVELAPQIIEQVELRLGLAQAAITDESKLLQQELTNVKSSIAEIELSQRALKQEAEVLFKRIELQRGWLKVNQDLFEKGQLTALALSESKDRLLVLEQAQVQLKRNKLSLTQEHRQARVRLMQLPLKYAENIRLHRQQASKYQQQLAELKNSFRNLVRAPIAGEVTAVHRKVGERISPGDLVITMVPEGSILIAELNVPTRSAGLLKIGQRILLRFDAFPYQRFGQLPAEVVQVDQTVQMQARNLSEASIGPVYRLRAHLDKQSLHFKHQEYLLRPGMQVEADILLERRRLLDWLLQPLIGFTAKSRAA